MSEQSAKKAKLAADTVAVVDVVGKNLLIVDSREPGEPNTYLVTITPHWPEYLRSRLQKHNCFEYVVFGDGAELLCGEDVEDDEPNQHPYEYRTRPLQVTFEQKIDGCSQIIHVRLNRVPPLHLSTDVRDDL